jgi:hypothetical protein
MIALATVRWTSTSAARDDVPQSWGAFRDDDLLLLKDTRGRYYKNRLVAPNEFVYVIPTHPKPWEEGVVTRLRARFERDPPLLVDLYSTPGARDESYGRWVLRRIVNGPKVCNLHLLRLADQPLRPTHVPTYRSANETHHARVLEEAFPSSDWVVAHEPETVLDLHQPSVVDGVPVDEVTTTRSYTCDFVVTEKRGWRRLCVESKPCEEHVTPEALVKARFLRDATLARVVFMVGGVQPRWLDLGAPRTTDVETWHETTAAFLSAHE